MKTLVIALMLSVCVVGCGSEEVGRTESVRPVRVYTVNGGAYSDVRTFPGKVEAAQRASLSFRISGEIVQFAVKQGEKVEKGQLIALLDQRDYLAAAADLRARLAGARSVLNESRLNIERNKKLLQENIIAQSAYDAAQSGYESSRATVLSLEQSLKRADLDIQYTSILAPFSGTIAVTHVDNHEFVQANEPIVELEDASSLDVVIDVPESYWTRVQKARKAGGAEAVAHFESFPGQSFPLTIKEFQTTANSATQTYEVTLSMKAPEELGISPGMTAEVVGKLGVAASDEKPLVPFASVAGPVGGALHVWVLDENQVVHKRTVSVGRVKGDKIYVLEGIERGEVVVAAGANYLKEGQKVRVLDGRIGGRE